MDIDSWPKTREQALFEGKKFYFPGTPCRKGHIALRYASSGNCLQCVQERNNKFRELREEGIRRSAANHANHNHGGCSCEQKAEG